MSTNINPVLRSERRYISKEVKKFSNARSIRDLMLCAPAGLGKTTTVVKALVELNERVRLTVQTNDMVMKQAAHLSKELKIKCQTITSFEHNVYEAHGITIPKKKKSHPWDFGHTVDSNIVKKLFKSKYTEKSDEEIQDFIDACKSDEPDYENYDVVIMTHFRPLMLQITEASERTKQILELNSFTEKADIDKIITIVDDPSFDSICKYKVTDKDQKYAMSNILGQKVKVVKSKTKDNVFLYVKTDNMTINHGTEAKTIWISAEKTIMDMIIKNKNKKFYKSITADLSDIEFGDSNGVTLIGTNIVRSKHHGILGMLIERTNRLVLRHGAKEPIFIADGLGLFNNTVNIRGRNDFVGENIIYKCSRPHGKIIEAAQQHLGDVSYDEVCKQLMLDTYTQVCGRTKGSRGEIAKGKKAKNSSVIVLVEHQYIDCFKENSPYKILNVIDLEINPSKRRMPEEQTYENILCWLISNNYAYLTNDLLGLSSGGDASKRVNNDFTKDIINMRVFDIPKVIELIKTHLNIRVDELKGSKLHKDVNEREALHLQLAYFTGYEEQINVRNIKEVA